MTRRKVVRLIRNGQIIYLEMGIKDPVPGDYLIEEGNASRILMVTYKKNTDGRFLVIETKDAPGILQEYRGNMNIGRIKEKESEMITC